MDRREELRRRRERTRRERQRPPAANEDDPSSKVPVVPWVYIACHYCGSREKETRGQKGNLRYHRCKSCGRDYRSLEFPPPHVKRMQNSAGQTP